jgi:CubicO group peptidase (beta-lactamase class C family)
MTRTIIFVVALVLIACATRHSQSRWPSNSATRAPVNRLPLEVDGTTTKIDAQVDAYVKPYLDLGGFNGCILIAKGGPVLLSRCYGMANYELSVPNTPRTKFHLASVSKTFTAAAIMILQEHGLLNVRDPLAKFIPDYPNGDRISLQHLLTNTSGIPNVNNFPEYATQSKFPHTPAELVAMFKQKPLDFEPGTKGYTESNSNYNLLAFIIEKLSGQNYGEFLQQNIFLPLGLHDTAHDGDASALVPNKASGYVPAGLTDLENAPYLDWSIKTGNGSIYSTIEDLYRWDRALYTEKVLKKNSLTQMFKEEYGWFSGKRLNRNVVRMNGRSPGFNSDLQRYIDDDVCIVVLANNYVPTASVIANDLAKIVFGEPYETPKFVKPAPLDPKILDTYVARYQFGPDFFVPNGIYSIQRKGERLQMVAPGADATLVPQTETEFFDRPFWSTVVFVRNNEGKVTHLLWRFGGRDYRAARLPEDSRSPSSP